MTTTLEKQPTQTQNVSDDLFAALNEIGEKCRSKSKYYREALRAIAGYFRSPYATIRITESTHTLDERVHQTPDDAETWEAAAQEVLLRSQVDNEPIARLYGIKDTDTKAALMAVPVCENAQSPIGAMAIVSCCNDASLAKAHLREYSALVSLIATRAQLIGANAKSPSSEDDSSLKRAFVKAADFQSLHEMAFAITNTLKNKFGCDQVVLGQVQKKKVRILSISGLDDLYPKSPGVKHIQQAMEECLDHGDVRHESEAALDPWTKDTFGRCRRLCFMTTLMVGCVSTPSSNWPKKLVLVSRQPMSRS